MSLSLALPAAKLALSAAGSIVDGVKNALDPNKTLDTAKTKAKKQADEFETVFLEQYTDKLFGSSETEGPLGENGQGGGIYRSMLTQQYAKKLQQAGGVGLSDQIFRDLLKVQEKAGAATTAAAATTTVQGTANVRG
jgi:Rod binding domain-containing protein